jgi:hypothetical protein
MTSPWNAVPARPARKTRAVLKTALIAVAVIAVPPALLQLSWLVGTAKMVIIADRMQPNPGWVQDGEHVSGGIFCIAVAVPCDSMWRSYRSQHPVP